MSRKNSGAAAAAPEPTRIQRAKAGIEALDEVHALRTLALQWAQNAIELEGIFREAMDMCRNSQQAARDAIIRLHNAGGLGGSAADMAALKALRI